MLYIITSPGCPRCAERLTELKGAGREFVEVDGRDVSCSTTGKRFPTVIAMALLTEFACHEWEVPVELELKERDMSWVAVVIKYLPVVMEFLQSKAFKQFLEDLGKLLGQLGEAFESEQKAD